MQKACSLMEYSRLFMWFNAKAMWFNAKSRRQTLVLCGFHNLLK